MRWLIGLAVVVAIGVGALFWMRSRGDSPKPAASAPRDAPVEIPPRPTSTMPPRPATEVSEQQEAAERKVIEDFARDQKLATAETDKVLGALKVLQDGRRQLFADLKDRRILIGDLSARLGELRAAMNK